MRIIRHRSRRTERVYEIFFSYVGHEGTWGFAFACDEAGKIEKLNPCSQRSYEACLTGVVDGRQVLPGKLRSWNNTISESAIGLCDCGQEVFLTGFTNTCNCGADYNTGGQRLAPREQWGEE